jgi:hypothetical protein
MSKIIPNSFQTPNYYVDVLMELLTPEEFKVLSYASRRIFGFQKRKDRISLSQFTTGTTNDDNEKLDTGTGMSINTVRKCLASLSKYGIIRKIAPNNPKQNKGDMWTLELDIEKIALAELEVRFLEKKRKNIEKMTPVMARRGLRDTIGGSNVTHEGGGNVAQQHKSQKKASRKPVKRDKPASYLEILRAYFTEITGWNTPLTTLYGLAHNDIDRAKEGMRKGIALAEKEGITIKVPRTAANYYPLAFMEKKQTYITENT